MVPAMNEAEGGDPERRPRPALAGHLVPIQAGDDGGRFPRDIDENGCGGSSVLGAVIDPRDHDDGGCRVHVKCQGDQQGNGPRGPNPRQHPHGRSHEDAEEAGQELGGLKADRKSRDHSL